MVVVRNVVALIFRRMLDYFTTASAKLQNRIQKNELIYLKTYRSYVEIRGGDFNNLSNYSDRGCEPRPWPRNC